jgi:hypothetical protein
VVRKITFGFALLFIWVVASGYIPRFITYEGTDRIQFGLFRLSVIDDVTHGVTALAALVASLASLRLSLLFLTAFGFYYALDAIFYLTYGLFNDKGLVPNILLNLPHVLIATAMLGIVYYLAPKWRAAGRE